MEAKKLKHLVIELMHGDITSSTADILVNAANNELWMGAGVAGAIKAKGGIDIEKEAVAKGPIPIGASVETGAGRLNARYVVHAAVMGTDFRTNEQYIRNATETSLILSDKLKMDSVCFPALGTGVGRFPLDKCAEVMFDEVKKFDGTKPEHLKRVEFCLFSRQAFDAFENMYRKI